ncbi:mavicyanin-like [Phalaenopsis equestris]|uniref:mavicyanin-like n=1 Tax=Phalaenopsis equestris TaxID=78828 RepID=UPI0009E30B1E|nr:mavicyanin-like [Phalaenopsis equestris]
MSNLNCILLLSLAPFFTLAGATQHKVGGSMGWTVPTDPNSMSYNQWAEKNRFQIGDTLLFVYQPDQDSVLQVDKIAYKHCNTSSYIARFDDGNTVFTLNMSGPFYFISGVEGNCIRNESLIVVVMADKSISSASHPPPPSPESVSPPPPMEGTTPSPAPEVAASVPPPSPPSGASMKLVSYFGLVGGGVGLLLFVL